MFISLEYEISGLSRHTSVSPKISSLVAPATGLKAVFDEYRDATNAVNPLDLFSFRNISRPIGNGKFFDRDTLFCGKCHQLRLEFEALAFERQTSQEISLVHFVACHTISEMLMVEEIHEKGHDGATKIIRGATGA